MTTKQTFPHRKRLTYTAAEDRALHRLRAEGGFVPFQGMPNVERQAFCALTKRGLARFEAYPFPGYVLIGG